MPAVWIWPCQSGRLRVEQSGIRTINHVIFKNTPPQNVDNKIECGGRITVGGLIRIASWLSSQSIGRSVKRSPSIRNAVTCLQPHKISYTYYYRKEEEPLLKTWEFLTVKLLQFLSSRNYWFWSRLQDTGYPVHKYSYPVYSLANCSYSHHLVLLASRVQNSAKQVSPDYKQVSPDYELCFTWSLLNGRDRLLDCINCDTVANSYF